MTVKSILKITLLSLLSIVILTNCENNEDPFASINPTDSLSSNIKDFNAISRGYILDEKKEAIKHSVYIDFSPGIDQAFRKQETFEFFDAIIKGISDKADYFKLAGNNITPIKLDLAQLNSFVTNIENFKEHYAPIEKAMQEIVSNNSQALIISDCEEVPDKIENLGAYAERSFTDWLNKGNQIDFYVTDHIDDGSSDLSNKGILKHLYFIVFTPRNEIENDNNLLNVIKSSLKAANKGKEIAYTLNTKFYSTTQDYKSEKSSGIKEELSDPSTFEQVNYVNDRLGNFEYIPLLLTPSYIKSQLTVGDKHLLRKLFLDLSQDNAYIIKDVGIKLYDVYDDYFNFFKANTARKHKPKLEKDQNTGATIFAAEGNDEFSLFCFNQDGKLKPEYEYKKGDLQSKGEIFKLNSELFKNTYSEHKNKCEIGIELDPNFNGTQISNERDNLLRIDVIIKDCDENYNNSKLDKFEWNSIFTKGEKNKSLRQSITNTLRNVNPKGTVIYTYYVKFLPNDIELN